MDKKGGNRILWGIICVAAVAIIGLSITIAVMFINKGNGQPGTDNGDTTSNDDGGDDFDSLSNEEKAKAIMLDDMEKARREEAENYAIENDNEKQSVESATLVMNVASYYSDNDLYNKYYEILSSRLAENGQSIGGEGGQG